MKRKRKTQNECAHTYLQPCHDPWSLLTQPCFVLCFLFHPKDLKNVTRIIRSMLIFDKLHFSIYINLSSQTNVLFRFQIRRETEQLHDNDQARAKAENERTNMTNGTNQTQLRQMFFFSKHILLFAQALNQTLESPENICQPKHDPFQNLFQP